MEVQFALVCDCANVTENGKLNVMGEFDNILSPSFPCVHSTMYFVAKVRLGAADPDELQFELRVIDQDGALAANPISMLARRAESRVDGELTSIRIALQIVGAQFREEGVYSFELLGNGQRLHSVELGAKQLPPPSDEV